MPCVSKASAARPRLLSARPVSCARSAGGTRDLGDGSDPFIQALFWCPTPLLEQMVVVRSLPAFSLGLWHTRSSKMEAKEMRRRGILCQLDDLADILREKLHHDNDLLRIEEDFPSILMYWASVIVTARI